MDQVLFMKLKFLKLGQNENFVAKMEFDINVTFQHNYVLL